MEELISVIEKTLSSDQTLLNESLSYFETASNVKFSWLAAALTEIISGNVLGLAACKQQAALQLKNLVRQRGGQWVQLDNHTRAAIKAKLLHSLGTYEGRGLPQCIQSVAELELPAGSWPDLVPALLNAAAGSGPGHPAGSPGHSAGHRKIALETIGYICETVSPDHLELHVNHLLTVVVHCIRDGQHEGQLRLTALTALQNSLEFAAANFARLSERNYLMQVICESTQEAEVELAVQGLQCLCRTISLYYPLMEDYLCPAIWPISIQAVASNKEHVVFQGLELWNSVCEAEIDLLEDGDQGSGWIQPVLGSILPALIIVLVEDAGVGEDWSLGKGAQASLRLLARATGDHVLPHVLPFLEQNLASQDDRLQAAALACLAGVLEGPQPRSLLPLVHALTDLLGSILNSPSTKVRIIGSQAASQLCLLHSETLVSIGRLPYILEVLVMGLRSSEVVVAEHCCWSLSIMMQRLTEDCVYAVYLPCLQNLVSITDPAHAQGNLVFAGYETLRTLIQSSPDILHAILEPLLPLLLSRIYQAFTTGVGHTHQTSLFGVVECLAEKIGAEKIPEEAENLVNLFSSVLLSESPVREEMVGFMSKLVSLGMSPWLRYSGALLQALSGCLLTARDGALLQAALGLTGDIYRGAREEAHTLNLDHTGLVHLLLRLLQDPDISRDVKPACLGTLSDIILSVGEGLLALEKPVLQVVEPVLQVLEEAGRVCLVRSDPVYCEELARSVVDTFSSTLQTLQAHPPFRNRFVQAYLENLLSFMQEAGGLYRDSQELLATLSGLVGDIFKFFGDIVIIDEKPWIHQFLENCSLSGSPKLCKISRWALTQIQTVGSADVRKKARMNGGSRPEEIYTMRVTLTCSGQYITQCIEEETVTLSLNPIKLRDIHSNHVEATVKLPSRPSPKVVFSQTEVVYRPAEVKDADISQLRRLRKRRVAVTTEGSGKKSRDEEDIWW